MSVNIALALTNNLTAAGLPVSGVRIGANENKATWVVEWALPPTQAQQTQAADIITAFDPTSPATLDAERTALARASSRQKDKLADIAWAIRRVNVTAWGLLTNAQQRTSVLNEADDWRDMRVWIERNW